MNKGRERSEHQCILSMLFNPGLRIGHALEVQMESVNSSSFGLGRFYAATYRLPCPHAAINAVGTSIRRLPFGSFFHDITIPKQLCRSAAHG
jgi:hypothetical protein